MSATDATPTGIYGSWSAMVRGGFKSNNRVLAFVIRILDIGPCSRPVTRWTPLLLLVALVGVSMLFLDGVFTALALSDPSHPFVVEAWWPTAQILAFGGIPGLLVSKLAVSLFLFVYVLDLSRLRGLTKSVWAMSLLFMLLGGLLVANSLSILLSPPTLLY